VLLIVVGALVAAHTLGIAVYYVLPVDAEGKKYIPGTISADAGRPRRTVI
jgi:hypothetical protein